MRVTRTPVRLGSVAAVVSLICAVSPASARSATGPTTLWNNSSVDGYVGVPSDSYVDPAGLYASSTTDVADDFTVPRGATWTITEVDASGFFAENNSLSPLTGPSLSAGPADGLVVAFYVNVNGLPAGDPVAVRSLDGTAVSRDGRVVAAFGSSPVVLGTGKYFVELQAQMNRTLHGTWYWLDSYNQAGASAVYREPGQSGSACHTWCTLPAAWPSWFGGPTDMAFQLRGTAA